jgi:hypothetical protein
MHLPAALALFCEDIRQEKNDINSLIGILPDNISVEGFPGFAPKLGVYIRINFDPKQQLVPISYELILPDGKAVATDKIKTPILEKAQADSLRDGNPVASLVSRVVMSPFPFEQAGRIQVLVNVGEIKLFAGSINVRIATSSSETPQPSELSPDASQPKDS